MRDAINSAIIAAGLILLAVSLIGCHGLQGKSVNATYETAGLGIVSGYGILNFGYVKATYHSDPTNAPAK